MLPAQRIAVALGLATTALGLFLALAGIFWTALQVQPTFIASAPVGLATQTPAVLAVGQVEAFQLTSFLLVVVGLVTSAGGFCSSLAIRR